jgi:hypothetical protein
MDTGARARAVTIVAATLMVTLLAAARSMHAFGGDYHREITRQGLRSGPNDYSFLRTAVRRSINHQHRWMDDGFPSGRGGDDEKHFDDCEFNGAADFIKGSYRVAQNGLTDVKPWVTTAMFGNILHVVQDFYSHSNWVELGFPLRSQNVPSGTRSMSPSQTWSI